MLAEHKATDGSSFIFNHFFHGNINKNLRTIVEQIGVLDDYPIHPDGTPKLPVHIHLKKSYHSVFSAELAVASDSNESGRKEDHNQNNDGEESGEDSSHQEQDDDEIRSDDESKKSDNDEDMTIDELSQQTTGE